MDDGGDEDGEDGIDEYVYTDMKWEDGGYDDIEKEIFPALTGMEFFVEKCLCSPCHPLERQRPQKMITVSSIPF